jgi:hypothetical protein
METIGENKALGRFYTRSLIRGGTTIPLRKHSSAKGPYSSLHVNPTPKGTSRICLHWRNGDDNDSGNGDNGEVGENASAGDDFWLRCCWLATKPYSEYQLIETQVMVTPKKKAIDVSRMHLEYKWELPINHDLESLGKQLDAMDAEGRGVFFILRDDVQQQQQGAAKERRRRN